MVSHIVVSRCVCCWLLSVLRCVPLLLAVATWCVGAAWTAAVWQRLPMLPYEGCAGVGVYVLLLVGNLHLAHLPQAKGKGDDGPFL